MVDECMYILSFIRKTTFRLFIYHLNKHHIFNHQILLNFSYIYYQYFFCATNKKSNNIKDGLKKF
jgi:hypothetical protein